MQQITVQNITVDIIKKDIKNIHLAVYPPHGRVRVAAPKKTNDESIRLLLLSRIVWIKKHQKKFIEQTREAKREYINGESHYLFGKRYLLNIIEQPGKAQVQIRNKKYLDLSIPQWSDKKTKEKIIRKRYRQQLIEQISPLISKREKAIGVKSTSFSIRKMKTKRWSCIPTKKKLRFNIELVKKPFNCIEYIVVHELIHLLERNHNEKFTRYMNKFLPQWEVLRKQLNNLVLVYE